MARFDDFTARELDVLDGALELLTNPREDDPDPGYQVIARELLSELRGHGTTDEHDPEPDGAAIWLTRREATLLWAAVAGDLRLHSPTEEELDALDRKLEAVPDEE